MRDYCEDDYVWPISLRPPFLSEALILQIKYVKENVKQFYSKSIYRTLLLKELDQINGFKLKVEDKNKNKIGLLWCHSQIELRLIEVVVNFS